MEENLTEFDIGIIGGGPAGLSASIYGARRGLICAVFEGKAFGGAMYGNHLVENYPGFGRVVGSDLAGCMKKHAEGIGSHLFLEQVSEIEQESDGGFVLKTASGKTFSSRSLILATGSAYKQLRIAGEKELAGRGVSYCATCDAPFFKGMRVAIIGSGSTALNTALILSEVAKGVTVIHDEPLQDPGGLEARLREKGVDFMGGVRLTAIEGEGAVERIRVRNLRTGEEKALDVQGVFINIGLTPITTLARSIGVNIDERGFVIVDEKQLTSVPGVFAAGDCVGRLMQIVRAVAEGAQAALSAAEYLKGAEKREP